MTKLALWEAAEGVLGIEMNWLRGTPEVVRAAKGRVPEDERIWESVRLWATTCDEPLGASSCGLSLETGAYRRECS